MAWNSSTDNYTLFPLPCYVHLVEIGDIIPVMGISVNIAALSENDDKKVLVDKVNYDLNSLRSAIQKQGCKGSSQGGSSGSSSFTETDPTVPAWAKKATKPAYTAAEVGALPSTTKVPEQMVYAITEDDITVAYDSTKGVSPYSTSYGYTNVTISEDAGVEWMVGAIYRFMLSTKVATSTYRNVRVRIGETGDWKPLCSYAGSASAQYSLFVKAHNTTFVYDTRYFAAGGLTHMNYDSNTTYAYLVNTVAGDNTSSQVKIASNGYGARYSLMFPTSRDETEWSSLMASSSSATTKKANACTFYAQHDPMYVASANVAAGDKPINPLYQYYQGADLRYTANTSTTYMATYDKVYLWLKDFNSSDKSFKSDATIGNVVSQTKLSARFPSTGTSEVYLYLLGWNTATWYTLNPIQVDSPRIWKYVPSTGALLPFSSSSSITEEQDPVFTSSAAYSVTSAKITKWDSAYSNSQNISAISNDFINAL